MVASNTTRNYNLLIRGANKQMCTRESRKTTGGNQTGKINYEETNRKKLYEKLRGK